MNHQHHLKSDPKFGRFGRFSRGGGARGGDRGDTLGYTHSDDGGALGLRPSGPRSQGLRGHGRKALGAFGGSCGQIFGLLFRVLAT